VTEITVALKYPITVVRDGQKHALGELSFRRVKAKDLMDVPPDLFSGGGQRSPVDFLPLLAAMSGLSEEEIGELDLADLTQIIEGVAPFFGESPLTGETSSGE
jgi:hypothetical protein